MESQAAAADPVFGSNGRRTRDQRRSPPALLTVNPSFPDLLNRAGAPTAVTRSFAGTVSGGDDGHIDFSGSYGLENGDFLID